MKTNFRKSIAMIVCVCFLFTGLVGNYVYAESTTGTSNMKIVQNDDNICKVVGEYDEGTAYAILNKNTNEVTLETVEKSKNKIFGFGKGKSRKANQKSIKSKWISQIAKSYQQQLLMKRLSKSINLAGQNQKLKHKLH
jgi:cob(I)alamin adenosyltransferase